jgi:hypothetical protein
VGPVAGSLIAFLVCQNSALSFSGLQLYHSYFQYFLSKGHRSHCYCCHASLGTVFCQHSFFPIRQLFEVAWSISFSPSLIGCLLIWQYKSRSIYASLCPCTWFCVVWKTGRRLEGEDGLYNGLV